MVRVVWTVFLMFLGVSIEARAFIYESEEQQWQGDVKEAISRARDFQNQLVRQRRAEQEREAGAELHKSERERQAQELEKAREQFVRARNEAPDEEAEREILEREWVRANQREDLVMDENRKKYLKDRERIRALLKSQAYIDEMLEYNLVEGR